MSEETKPQDEQGQDDNLYAQIRKDLKEDLTKEIKEEVTSSVTSEVKKEFARKATNFAVPKTEEKGSLGEWLQAITFLRGHKADPDSKTKAYNLLKEKYAYNEKSTMVQGTAGSGGDLVPVNYSNQLFTLEGFDSVFFPTGGNIFQMASNVEKYPSWDYTVTPSGSGDSAFGAGYVPAYVAENNAPTPTNPVTKQITFTADKVMTLTDVSNELVLNNIVGLEQALTAVQRNEAISLIDYFAFNGNGQNCTGFIGHASTIAVPRDASGDVKLEDLAKMYARMLPRRFSTYTWVVHPGVLPNLLQLATASGQLVWLPNGMASGVDMRIFGIPVIVSDNCGALGEEGDVCLVSRNCLGIGVNKNITIDVSQHAKFGYDLTEYRLTAHVAIKPMLVNKVKAKDGSYTLSAFIVLDDATS